MCCNYPLIARYCQLAGVLAALLYLPTAALNIYSIYLLLLISSVVSTVCRHTNNCAKRRTVGPGAGACLDIKLPHTTPFHKIRLSQNKQVNATTADIPYL